MTTARPFQKDSGFIIGRPGQDSRREIKRLNDPRVRELRFIVQALYILNRLSQQNLPEGDVATMGAMMNPSDY